MEENQKEKERLENEAADREQRHTKEITDMEEKIEKIIEDEE